MKTKRYKNSYRVLTFFKHHYKIVPPYRVLVDGSFCWAALQNQINLREQIPKYLDAETEIVTTKCILQELESIGSAVHGATVVCKQFMVDKCPHKEPVAARECMKHLAKLANKDGTKYIMATQDDILKNSLRKRHGIPILFIAFKSILFDKITDEAKEAVESSNPELEKVKEQKKEILGEAEVVKKKKKKIKGKNPLSCKKKILKPSQVSHGTGAKTAAGKRRRKKNSTVVPPSTSSMPSGTKIVPDEYLALHFDEVICSLIVTPKAPVRSWLVVGTNDGNILFYPADVNHTEQNRKVVPARQRVHDDSPIEALACGKLTGAFSTEIVTVCADGTLTTFTPPIDEGDLPTINHNQLIQANVRAAYIMDVDNDGNQELVIILTDRVVRTYRFSAPENRLLPINKWEVPCQITGYAIGASSFTSGCVELILSQMGVSYYIIIPLSGGGDKVELIYQSDNRQPAVMMLPHRVRYAGIMGSMMDNLSLGGKYSQPALRERSFLNTGFPLIGACACLIPSGMELIATVDIRGMVLIYAALTPVQDKKEEQVCKTDIEAVAFFETDESCEYMTMTVIDDETVMMSVANIFRHLFLYKIKLTDIRHAIKQHRSSKLVPFSG